MGFHSCHCSAKEMLNMLLIITDKTFHTGGRSQQPWSTRLMHFLCAVYPQTITYKILTTAVLKYLGIHSSVIPLLISHSTNLGKVRNYSCMHDKECCHIHHNCLGSWGREVRLNECWVAAIILDDNWELRFPLEPENPVKYLILCRVQRFKCYTGIKELKHTSMRGPAEGRTRSSNWLSRECGETKKNGTAGLHANARS